jgi:hypothetical protein
MNNNEEEKIEVTKIKDDFGSLAPESQGGDPKAQKPVNHGLTRS